MLNPFEPLPHVYRRLTALRSKLIALNLPKKQRSLHDTGQQRDRETWHAFLFAYAYSVRFGLWDMCLQLAEDQYSPHDATLRWIEDGQQQFLKIQLKELVPPHVSDKGTLQELVTKALKRFGKCEDVALVVYLNREGYIREVMEPDHQMGGLWFFCFTKPDHSEIFLAGYDSRHSYRGIVSYATPVT